MIVKCLAAGAALLTASPTFAATVKTTIASWGGSTGYVFGRPVIDSNNVVYGVLGYGASGGAGSVYALKPVTGSTTYAVSTISSFTSGASGASPVGGLLVDNSKLFGATIGGGSSAINECKYSGYAGCGIIYQLTPPSSGTTWTRTTLYTFLGGTDGNGPVGDLIADSAHNLYGITVGGGCTATLVYPNGCGTVFKLTPPVAPATRWSETILYRFAGGLADGATPTAPLAMDAAGNIYGTTMFGGTVNCATYVGSPDGGCGTVFELANTGVGYSHAILHLFTDHTDGSLPGGGVVLNTGGDVFGSTLQGGAAGVCANFGYSGCGVVFKMTPPASGTAWKKTNVVAFAGTNGATPYILSIDAKNHLFGVATNNTAAYGGCTVSYYCGSVFKEFFTNSVWTNRVLAKFTGEGDLAHPEFGLGADAAGNLYGVTEYGTTSTVMKLSGSTY